MVESINTFDAGKFPSASSNPCNSLGSVSLITTAFCSTDSFLIRLFAAYLSLFVIYSNMAAKGLLTRLVLNYISFAVLSSCPNVLASYFKTMLSLWLISITIASFIFCGRCSEFPPLDLVV